MTKRYSMTDGVRKEMTDAEIAELKQDAPLTDLEIYMNRVRRKRNSLLQETDWWASSDLTMTDADKKYRQDLRDLTNGLDTAEKAKNVTWPTNPRESS
jgi:hypothetical protein|tara:strand:+ start:581 stop:874 length:294 start_codon:yes stop_codon:yes gene_type:complete